MDRWGEVADQFFLDQKLWFRASVLAERYWSANATIASYSPTGGCTRVLPPPQRHHRVVLPSHGLHARLHPSSPLSSRLPPSRVRARAFMSRVRACVCVCVCV